ncbi:MAG: fibrobacter succinogenes major paralogous domain-containing protein [Chitinispirillia bacterium]|nr:fibrobacter succinogenes major paralogous domain-containing protein [Chitinispirillia bacterium]MCL2241349.1 fibrobacter succinogenes major paralogous domain-containing protein [Chitinispirillia bacterium]
MRVSVRKVAVLAAALALSAVVAAGCDGDNNSGGSDNPGGTDHTHSWGDWSVTTQATCNAPGLEIRYCTLDNTHSETKTTAQLTDTECSGGSGSVTIDGQSYHTVKIGNLTWMAENLNRVTSSSWCYDDDNSNCTKYGRLYTWDAAMTACPSGWRLPDTANWRRLVEVAGGRSVAGSKLKSTSGWNDRGDGTSGNGTDEFGFSALPGGARDSDGTFALAGVTGNWWSATEGGLIATESENRLAWSRLMRSTSDSENEGPSGKHLGFSVRCVR